MDEPLDQRLQQLLEAVQKTEQGTTARRRTLSELIQAFWPIAEGLLIEQRHKYDLLDKQYDDDMQEILDHSIRQFGDRIDQFTMDKAKHAEGSIKWALMHWFKDVCRLQYAVLDYCRRPQKLVTSLDAPLGDGDLTLLDTLEDKTADGLPRLTGLEKYIEELQVKCNRAVAQAIRKILAEDPALVEAAAKKPPKRLSTCHPKNRSDCNCLAIVQLQFQKEYRYLTEISKELSMHHQTLNSHYYRRCIPLLHALVTQHLGYDPVSEIPLS